MFLQKDEGNFKTSRYGSPTWFVRLTKSNFQEIFSMAIINDETSARGIKKPKRRHDGSATKIIIFQKTF